VRVLDRARGEVFDSRTALSVSGDEPALTKDGRIVCFTRRATGGGVVRYDLEGRREIPLPSLTRAGAHAELHGISPDGRFLVVVWKGADGYYRPSSPAAVLDAESGTLAFLDGKETGDASFGWSRGGAVSGDGRLVVRSLPALKLIDRTSGAEVPLRGLDAEAAFRPVLRP
jgi:hypothetical protein